MAITDANLVLGRILPQYFPKIFGPSENEPLDSDAANRAMEEIRKEINKFSSDRSAMSKEDVALGFVDVANEKMCRPIRALTQVRPGASFPGPMDGGERWPLVQGPPLSLFLLFRRKATTPRNMC